MRALIKADWLERARTLLLENMNLKILSFGLALALYSLAHGAQDAQRTVAVDLVVLLPKDSANRVLMTQIPARVRVTLRGSRNALDELRADDVGTLQLDLQSGTEKRVALEPRMAHVPPGLRVEQIDPPELELHWEDLVVRDVPVHTSVVGTPTPGFVVRGVPTSDPPVVRLHGPKSEVSVVQYARSDAFDVTGLSEGKHTRSLSLDRPQIRLRYDVTTVLVTTEIAREIADRRFTKVPVYVTGQPKARVQPAEVDVRLTCPPEIVHALRPEQVVARVEVTAKDPTGSLAVPVAIAVDQCAATVIPPSVIVRW